MTEPFLRVVARWAWLRPPDDLYAQQVAYAHACRLTHTGETARKGNPMNETFLRALGKATIAMLRRHRLMSNAPEPRVALQGTRGLYEHEWHPRSRG